MLGRCENIMDFFVSHESFRFASLGPVAIEDVDSWLLPRFIARYRLIIDKDESRRNGCSGQMCPLITSCTSPLR